jgi:DNA-binding GntR family transcriptional regulator
VFDMEHEQATGRAGAVYTDRMPGHQDELAEQDPRAYLHIHSVLARRIRDGEYPAGAKLPTETELAEEFGCRPGTAGQALRALQRDGLARRVLRKGFLSAGPDNHPR